MSLENGEILKVQSSSDQMLFEIPLTSTRRFHPPSHWLQERKTENISG